MTRIENGKIRDMTPDEITRYNRQRNDRWNRETLGRAVQAYVSSCVTPQEVVNALKRRGLPVYTDV